MITLYVYLYVYHFVCILYIYIYLSPEEEKLWKFQTASPSKIVIHLPKLHISNYKNKGMFCVEQVYLTSLEAVGSSKEIHKLIIRIYGSLFQFYCHLHSLCDDGQVILVLRAYFCICKIEIIKLTPLCKAFEIFRWKVLYKCKVLL